MTGVINLFLISIYIFFMSQYMICGLENMFIKKTDYIKYNVLIVFCFMMFLNIFIPIKNIVAIFTIFLFYILSLAMYFIHEFRGTNLNFNDLKCIKTAKEVAGGYKYNIKKRFLICLFLNLFLTYVFIKNPIVRNTFREQTNFAAFEYFIRFFIRFIIILSKILIVFFLYNILIWKISSSYFDYSLNSGEKEGYIYNFISSIPYLHKTNVDEEDNEDLYEKMNFDNLLILNSSDNDIENLPHILVIMNESFGTVNRRIDTNIPVTPFYDNLSNVIKGDLYVNTFGGGTANTEFEFLTGILSGNMPYPIMPYNLLVSKKNNDGKSFMKYNIAAFLKNIGYNTIALHPYTATNYNRDIVYKKFLFDDLVFYDEFQNKNKIRNFVSDKSMYQEIIDRFEMKIRDNKKVFMFGVSIQNHSGYDKFNEETVIANNDLDNIAVNSYLSLLKLSDDALKFLVDYFKSIDEHVILCVFGDHNAGFGSEANKKYYDNSDEYEGTNCYITPYFIFDNKNNSSTIVETTSVNFLGNKILKLANLKLDRWQQFISDLNEKVDYMNWHKFKLRNVENMDYIDIYLQQYLYYQYEYLKING